jgi:hypothetical protein
MAHRLVDLPNPTTPRGSINFEWEPADIRGLPRNSSRIAFAELRNAIRHSTAVDEVTRMDGGRRPSGGSAPS